MRFEVFGEKGKKAIVLVHGYAITWRMWMPQIKDFSKDYYVIVPVLSAHDEEGPSEFISVQDEARAIIEYVKENNNGELFAICGASLGGEIVFEILTQNQLKIQKAIIDGGTGMPLNKILEKIMLKSKIKQQHQMRTGGEQLQMRIKAKMAGSWYPSELLDEAFKIGPYISDQSTINVCKPYTLSSDIQKTKADVAYWQGSKEKMLEGKTAKRVRELLPQATIEIFKGYSHGELCMGNPAEFIEKARLFFSK